MAEGQIRVEEVSSLEDLNYEQIIVHDPSAFHFPTHLVHLLLDDLDRRLLLLARAPFLASA